MKAADLVRAAGNLAVRSEIEARAAHEAELAAIDRAMHDKVALPEHYWETRYRAESKANAARDFAIALAEAFSEGE